MFIYYHEFLSVHGSAAKRLQSVFFNTNWTCWLLSLRVVFYWKYDMISNSEIMSEPSAKNTLLMHSDMQSYHHHLLICRNSKYS